MMTGALRMCKLHITQFVYGHMRQIHVFTRQNLVKILKIIWRNLYSCDSILSKEFCPEKSEKMTREDLIDMKVSVCGCRKRIPATRTQI